MATLGELTAFLEARLAVPDEAADDVPLLWRPAEHSGDLHCLGLALEYTPGTAQRSQGCDALFLHRPFRLPADALAGIPVLASHGGFDAHLTLGYNPALAAALGLAQIEPLFRPDRPGDPVPIGMIGVVSPPVTVPEWCSQIAREFGGLDETFSVYDIWEKALVSRAVVMNALNPTLIALAADLGANVCVTGQMRDGAREPARGRGVFVAAAGHERIEQWGLRRLAREIEQAFPNLAVRQI